MKKIDLYIKKCELAEKIERYINESKSDLHQELLKPLLRFSYDKIRHFCLGKFEPFSLEELEDMVREMYDIEKHWRGRTT
jgi:hypothetical protein